MLGWVKLAAALASLAEAGHERPVDGQLREQGLDCHRPVEEEVPGEVHLCHTAASDVPDDLVAIAENLLLFGLRHSTFQTRADPRPPPTGRWSATTGPAEIGPAEIGLRRLGRGDWDWARGQVGLDDRLGDRGGEGAALVFVGGRLIGEQHRDGDRRVGRRGERHEPGVDLCRCPVWAVPVLAATATPGIRAATPVPSGELTTESMSCVTWAAVAGEVACSHGLGW